MVRPPFYGGKFGSQKHQKYHAPNLACCFRMKIRSKLKEISGGEVWSDRPKLTIFIVCHLIRIVPPSYYSHYYLGWISELLGTGENHILSSLFFCAKNHVFGHRKRDIERKLESRGCFSKANIFALLKLKK